MRDARRSAGVHPRQAGNKAGVALSWLPLTSKSEMGLKAWGGLRCCSGWQGTGLAAPLRLASHPQVFNANSKLYVNTP